MVPILNLPCDGLTLKLAGLLEATGLGQSSPTYTMEPDYRRRIRFLTAGRTPRRVAVETTLCAEQALVRV